MTTDPAPTTIPITGDLLRGATECERTERGVLIHRLPARARAQCADPQLAMAQAQPSGVRLVLRTRATVLELDTVPTKRHFTGAPPRPDGVYDLTVDGHLTDQMSAAGGDSITTDLATGTVRHETGPTATVRFANLPGGDKDVEVWLPHNETTELVALRTDAPVEPAPNRGSVWLHHGSSISHGSNADSPTGTWPAHVARRCGLELVNLGFGGGALLDPFTARALRDTPTELISVKLGINLVNTDLMRLRAFLPAVHGFLDTIREGHPHTPLLLISPILCPIHEETPGPGAFDEEALRAGTLRFRATGDPAERSTASSPSASSARNCPGSSRGGRPRTRGCTISTVGASTGKRTTPSAHFRTSCIRTRPHTEAWGNASPGRHSPPQARSPSAAVLLVDPRVSRLPQPSELRKQLPESRVGSHRDSTPAPTWPGAPAAV